MSDKALHELKFNAPYVVRSRFGSFAFSFVTVSGKGPTAIFLQEQVVMRSRGDKGGRGKGDWPNRIEERLDLLQYATQG